VAVLDAPLNVVLGQYLLGQVLPGPAQGKIIISLYVVGVEGVLQCLSYEPISASKFLTYRHETPGTYLIQFGN
jgi:hypothetical protein